MVMRLICPPISPAVYIEWPRAGCGAVVLRCHDDPTHNVVVAACRRNAASRAPVRAGCGAGVADKLHDRLTYVHIIVLYVYDFYIYPCAGWI
jgi:hypothetical protein